MWAASACAHPRACSAGRRVFAVRPQGADVVQSSELEKLTVGTVSAQ